MDAVTLAAARASGDKRWQQQSWFDIRRYRPTGMTPGQVGDGVQLFSVCSATSGSNRVSVTGAGFTSADTGKLFAMMNGGNSNAATGQVLYGWMSYVDATHVDLFTDQGLTTPANAGQTRSNQNCAWGTPQDALLQAAFTAATVGSAFGKGGAVYLPAGVWVCAQPLPISAATGILGDGQQASILVPIINGQNFINNPTKTTPGLHFEKFSIYASYMGNTGGYLVSVKPLNISDQQLVTVTDVNIFDAPATAFPFDYSVQQTVLTRCVAINAGRTVQSATSAGGSGFGIGVKGDSADHPTMLVNCSAINCSGNYGFFIESQTGTAATQGSGHQLIGCYAAGNRIGIGLSGAANTIVQGCTLSGNKFAALAVDGGSYDPGMQSTLPLIQGNVIYGTFGDSAQILGSTGGSGVLLDGTKLTAAWQTRIKNNSIHHNLRAGIEIVADATDVYDVAISGNEIHDNGGPGIWARYAATATFSDATITSGSATVTTVAAEFSTGLHRGRPISGPGIPAGAHISQVINSKQVTISANATATTSGTATITIGQATAVLKRCRISHNTVARNGTAAVSNQADGIRVELPVSKCWFTGGQVFDDQGTQTQQRGLNFTGTVADTKVTDMDLSGNAQAVGLLFGSTPTGASVVRNNGGYNPVGAVTVTATASPWSFTAGERDGVLYINGGTVSGITRDGLTVANGTNKIIPFRAGQTIVTTYSAVPTGLIADYS